MLNRYNIIKQAKRMGETMSKVVKSPSYHKMVRKMITSGEYRKKPKIEKLPKLPKRYLK